jgi:hypothetical protein
VDKQRRVGQATDDNITRRMRIASCIIKATNTHSEYVKFIASALQKWFHETASILYYTYISSLINHAILQTESQITRKSETNRNF